MRYRLIAQEKMHHSVSLMARVLGVSRAGYYAWEKRKLCRRKEEDERLKTRISQIHGASFGIYGAPRVHAELADTYGIRIGRKRVARLMRELGIQGVSRRGKRKAKKTGAEAPAAPDLVKRDFTAERPDQLWLADITYISTWEGWLFLAAVVDVFTKRCCGWSMRNDMTADLVVDALGMAATLRRPGDGAIHHSDRGGQYRSLALGKTLKDSGIMASMGSKGDPYDNAPAESFFATIKTELIYRNTFRTREAARLAVFRYIEGFYNPVRRHSALGYKSPENYEKMLLAQAAGIPSGEGLSRAGSHSAVDNRQSGQMSEVAHTAMEIGAPGMVAHVDNRGLVLCPDVECGGCPHGQPAAAN
ncbi:MAG: IS3 family transposase [Planctomycetota bacterium]